MELQLGSEFLISQTFLHKHYICIACIVLGPLLLKQSQIMNHIITSIHTLGMVSSTVHASLHSQYSA